MKLVYRVEDKPPFRSTLIFAFQQMIAIMAATLLVPVIMSANGLKSDPAAALFGAGLGTLVYILFTKRKSPVFLGSSFTFLGAYEAIIGQNYGYWGVIIGVGFAAAVYVVIALVIKFVGSGWVNKIMPPVIIGPIVTLIGLSLSGTAICWMMANGVAANIGAVDYATNYNWVSIVCALFTFLAICFVSVKGGKRLKLIPFVVGVGAGYLLALIFTVIGKISGVEYLQVLNFNVFTDVYAPENICFQSFLDYPKLFIIEAIRTNGQYTLDAAAIGNIAMTFIPIGVVELAQHIGDHKNLSSIIEKDLTQDPGLDKTLLGDGIGSAVGTLCGCCANTTYGESIGCVAITGNASIVSIITAAVGCVILSFFTPFVTVINSIPKCVIGGACIALYGFIAVSGLQMIKKVDLGNSKNLFVVSAIFVCGLGGLYFGFGTNDLTCSPLLQITSLAAALIVGLITSLVVNGGKIGTGEDEEKANAEAPKEETEKVDQ